MFYSKIFANAIAKYNEGKLLSAEKIRRLIDAEFSDAVKMLIDYGYGGGLINEESYDIDVFITEETAKLLNFVKDDCPSEELKNCLLNKYLYSDAKVLYKSKFVAPDLKSALYGGFADLNKAFETNDFSNLPQHLSDALISLNERYIEKKANSKEIDLYITKAMYRDNLENAKKSGDKSLKKYVRTEIDFANILTAFRYKNLKLNKDDFGNEFLEGGYVTFDKIQTILTADNVFILRTFMDTEYSFVLEKLLSNEDFAIFERDADETLYNIMAARSEDMLSYSPFINYFMAKSSEFKIVKTVLVCLKNNARKEIARRIRSIYD